MLNPFNGVSAWWSYVTGAVSQQHADSVDWATQYQILDAYYYQNGLYEAIDTMLKARSTTDRQMKPLRCPAYRVTEFYAAKVWPGPLPDALPLETDNERIIEPLEQVWMWSNWETLKQTAVRTLAKKGDLFLQVATNGMEDRKADRVYFQLLQPEYVTDFDVDERGYLTWIRIDIPQSKRDANGEEKHYYHTQVWTKERRQVWKHEKSPSQKLDLLGSPEEERELSAMGIDYIPIVYQPLKGDHTKRAVGAYTLQLDKIDEINRQVTQLHAMLFRYNKPLWVTERTGTDGTGRPLPPVRVGVDSALERTTSEDDEIANLPGATTLNSLVPPINWDAALNVIAAQTAELKEDLPELAYYDLRNHAGLSGVAIRSLLSDTSDRAIEARGAAEAALKRADMMALDIGQTAGLFSGLGTYEQGAFDHTFRDRPVFEIDSSDRATVFGLWTQAGAPDEYALREIGETQDDIEKYQEDKRSAQASQSSGIAAALLNARSSFNRGETNGTQPQEQDE